MLCCFLLYTDMNQPQVYICPLPCECPSQPLPHPTPLGYHRALGMSSLHHTANSYWLSALYMTMHMFQLKHVFLQPWFRVPSGSLDCQHHADGILLGCHRAYGPVLATEQCSINTDRVDCRKGGGYSQRLQTQSIPSAKVSHTNWDD